MNKSGFRERLGRALVINRRLVMLVLMFFTLGLGGGVLLAEQPTHQPMAYNHSIHTAKMDCVRCHRGSREGRIAGIPSQVICTGCHATAPGKEPSKTDKSLWDRVLKGKPEQWNRLYRLSTHTFFSHRQHTTVSEIECEECHGLMKDQKRPPAYPLKPMMMRQCLDCHEKEKVTVDCTTCHR